MADNMINRLIYRILWHSDRAWNDIGEVRKGVKALKFKKDKVAVLQDNIRMHYLEMGKDDPKTNWQKNNKAKMVAEMTERLIEILKTYKGKTVPHKPQSTMPEQKPQAVVGTLAFEVRELYSKREEKVTGFNENYQIECQSRMESGEAATAQNMQHSGSTILGLSWVDNRIEYYAYYDIDKRLQRRSWVKL